MADSLNVLAVDPFHGGSHREFMNAVSSRSRHQWNVISGKPVHWKWRMRSAPIELAAKARTLIEAKGLPDVVFCTDMLDLPCWLGMMRRTGIDDATSILYFHENQLTYPVGSIDVSSDNVDRANSSSRVDHHFGYTNLLSAFAADACIFNSEFHRDDFFQASKQLIQRMPDGKNQYDWSALAKKCRVIAPGFEPSSVLGAVPIPAPSNDSSDPITIGWVSRWEADKRPDRLLEFCNQLNSANVLFDLILLGSRPRQEPGALTELTARFADQIHHNGFAETKVKYREWLARMDLVVSFADHEYFGIAICEAIEAGAVPIVPNRLGYLDTVPPACRYDSIDQAVELAQKFRDPSLRGSLREICRDQIQPFAIEKTVEELDRLLEKKNAQANSSR